MQDAGLRGGGCFGVTYSKLTRQYRPFMLVALKESMAAVIYLDLVEDGAAVRCRFMCVVVV